jgi:hypothetical protein
VRVVVALAGVVVVAGALQQAFRTFVVARAVSVPLSRLVFISMRRIFHGVVRLRGATDD